MKQEKRIAELLWSCDSYEQMCERVVTLEELVADMYSWLVGGHEYCESCSIRDACSDEYSEECTMRAVFEGRMKELGIPMEVES